MQKRPLGRSGLEIAPLMLGGNVFGWTADAKTSYALLDAFVEAGLNAVDTADVYSAWVPGHKGGESETVIGEWLKKSGKRNQVVIATKVGFPMGAEKGLAKDYIPRAAERSLKRLGVDVIDLYQAHTDDADTPLEETLGAFADLIKAGKVRAIGASNYTGARLKEALAVSAKNGLPRYETLQPQYNLYERAGFESDQAAICKAEGIGVIPYYGLASGFLTGKYRSEKDFGKSVRGGRMKSYFNERGFRILDALDAAAGKHKATPAQVALAWLMTRIAAPIASATKLDQLHDLLGAVRLMLDADAIKALDAASA